MTAKTQVERAQSLRDLFAQRIVVLDGAMGTMIQQHKLDEAAYRGERYADWHRDLKGCNDLLVLTRPRIIEDIHREMFGFEKTLFTDDFSIGLRLPIFQTVSGGPFEKSGVGDLNVILKYAEEMSKICPTFILTPGFTVNRSILLYK